MRTRVFALALLACVFGLAACSDDGDSDVGRASDGASDQSADGVTADNSTDATPAPQPEQSVPALTDKTEDDITVGGYVFENDGIYLLCETASDDDPPTCEGETLEIANGEVIDPSIFIGEEGSRYSDAEVVVTGDVANGVLTIG